MRVYVPLEARDLLEQAPPPREGCAATGTEELSGEELEVALESVLDEAAYLSLELVFESTGPARRLVAVGDDLETWNQVDAFYLDDEETSELIERARAVEEQGELDRLVERICSATMDWYDGSELEDLRAWARA